MFKSMKPGMDSAEFMRRLQAELFITVLPTENKIAIICL